MLANDYRRRFERLREEVEAEVRRRLVADRGAKAVARAMRRPLPEDVDFMHLGKEELAALQRTVQPLARKLAVHLARKRRGTTGRPPRLSCHDATFSGRAGAPRPTPVSRRRTAPNQNCGCWPIFQARWRPLPALPSSSFMRFRRSSLAPGRGPSSTA